MKKWLLILFSNMLACTAVAQQEAGETIEMADALRASGKIYVVVMVVSVILIGLIIYLINLDRKVSRLEKDFNERVAN